MSEKENTHSRLTHAAAKRASAMEAPTSQPPSKKKRVPLSDLPNLSNAATSRSSTAQSNPKKTRPEKKEKDSKREECSCKEIAVSCISVCTAADITLQENRVEDPQMAVPYASDIYQYLRSMEVDPKRRPLPNYVETTQLDLTAHMRGVLIDWLVEVAENYKLVSDTLYLTASYIDRFLSLNAINIEKLQLLGVASMLIASYESDCFISQNYNSISDLLVYCCVVCLVHLGVIDNFAPSTAVIEATDE